MRRMIPDNHKEDPQFLPLSVDTVHLTNIRSSLICGKNDLKMGQNGSNIIDPDQTAPTCSYNHILDCSVCLDLFVQKNIGQNNVLFF